jgi:hypothetical protein
MQTGMRIAAACVPAADACLALGRGSAFYESSPPQRRMRDLHAALQLRALRQRRQIAAGQARQSLTGRASAL